MTDIHWMARATRLYAWMIPGEARVFPLAELEQAKAWVRATPPSAEATTEDFNHSGRVRTHVRARARDTLH